MKLFNHWFKKNDETEVTTKKVVNSSTHVTTKELIMLQQKANKLDMSQRSYARSSSTGSHHSRFRGRGMDYQESRIYQAGDDIRNMDWRVTARAGKPHTKLYQEERERPVVLLVDFNPGMFFGSVKSLKSVLAAKTAALIAWSVSSRGDRIGALIINSTHHELPPKTGKRGVLQLIRQLVIQSDPLNALTKNNVSINEELNRLKRLIKPGSLVFIISDFYDINEETGLLFQQISRHNDIQAIQIVDPLELAPPPPDQYTVTDGNISGRINTKSKKGQEKYAQFFSEHHQKILNIMQKKNIPLIQLSTKDDVLRGLQHHFGKRSFNSSNRVSSITLDNKKDSREEIDKLGKVV